MGAQFIVQLLVCTERRHPACVVISCFGRVVAASRSMKMATFFLRQGKEIPSRSAFLHLRKLLAEFSFKENALRLIGVVIIVVAAADGLGSSVSHERASLHFDLESRELLLLGLSGRARMPNPSLSPSLLPFSCPSMP